MLEKNLIGKSEMGSGMAIVIAVLGIVAFIVVLKNDGGGDDGFV